MPTIEIYPAHPRPPWLRVGATCRNLGDGTDLYTILEVGERTVQTEDGAMGFSGLRQWPIPVPEGVPAAPCTMIWDADEPPSLGWDLRTWGERPLHFVPRCITVTPAGVWPNVLYHLFDDYPEYEEFELADGRKLVAFGYACD